LQALKSPLALHHGSNMVGNSLAEFGQLERTYELHLHQRRSQRLSRDGELLERAIALVCNAALLLFVLGAGCRSCQDAEIVGGSDDVQNRTAEVPVCLPPLPEVSRLVLTVAGFAPLLASLLSLARPASPVRG
jgi:hypothetical protein